jgi:hypothetical protein
MCSDETQTEYRSAASAGKKTSAERTRLYRERKRKNVRCVRVRLSLQAIGALAIGGFLPAAPADMIKDFELEAGIYQLINAALKSGLIKAN